MESPAPEDVFINNKKIVCVCKFPLRLGLGCAARLGSVRVSHFFFAEVRKRVMLHIGEEGESRALLAAIVAFFFPRFISNSSTSQ
jgi:hypothetical protein